MPVTAKLNYLRISPRKVRLIADLIRRKEVSKAETILDFTVKKATHPLSKLLKSAVASAKNDFHLDPDNLYISKIFVDEGPKYKRWMPRARGSASLILKKTSHVTLILDELKPSQVKGTKKAELKKEPELKNEQYHSSAEDVSESKNDGSRNFDKKTRKRSEIKAMINPKVEKGAKKLFRRKTV